MQKWVVIFAALLALAAADNCPDGGRCQEGQTCCGRPSSGFDCCPFDEAECCADHVHCCPKGMTCDLTMSSCSNSTAAVSWAERTSPDLPLLSKSFRMIRSNTGEDNNNICPDNSRCPAEFSCLRALTGFGCCPLAQGVPCSDGKHCCPEGHQCSLDSRSCIKTETVNTIVCKDGTSECPDGTTCCENPEGKWGCCPLPKAVCCADKTHCCPEGTTCDIAHLKCLAPSKKVFPMWAKFPARQRADWESRNVEEEVTAAVGKSPEATTANPAPAALKEWIVSAVAKAAAAAAGGIPPSSEFGVKALDVPCNDTTACADGSTCCKNAQGDWACCPFPEAVCCNDLVHCCPKGTKCNLPKQTCDGDGGSGSVLWVEKTPSLSELDVRAQNVSCDSFSSCQDGTTCCKNTEGGWGCCPLPEAVCCDDLVHCCPKGTKCNLPQQTCDSDSSSVPWAEKIPSFSSPDVKMQNVSCDANNSCPDGTTCCKKAQGGWGCCPLPQAVCCDDHIHCCPSGTTCDLATLTCRTGLGSVPMLEKLPALTPAPPSTTEPTRTESTTAKQEGAGEDADADDENEEEEEKTDENGDVVCDSHTRCPPYTTCCFMKEHKRWGCCPLPKAVCCDDGEHCCPSNYKCKEEGDSCVKGELSIPWYTKIPASVSAPEGSAVVQCGGMHQCPEHMSCCRLFTGEWGCCPLQNAVCCPDMEHCCPGGYTCDVVSNSCHKLILLQLETVPLTPVFLSDRVAPSGPIRSKENKCDDSYSCQDDETCCRTSPTSWGCCPSPNAVCCSDMKHCCASGYICTAGGSCTKKSGLPWHNWHMFFANKKRALIV